MPSKPAATSSLDVVNTTIDEAFAAFPPRQAQALRRTWDAAARILSEGQPCISWGMPTLRAAQDGPYVMSLMGFRHHNSLFPHSGAVAERLKDELGDRVVTKGTIHFDLEKPFPVALLRKVLAVRIEEVNDSYPRRNGEMRVYNRNGSLRSVGKSTSESARRAR